MTEVDEVPVTLEPLETEFLASLDFLGNYGPSAVERVNARFNPKVKSGDLLPFLPLGMTPYVGAQAETLWATIRCMSEPLREDHRVYKDGARSIYMVGEPGVGKTLLGAGVAASLQYRYDFEARTVVHTPRVANILVESPPIMLEKWKRHILKIDKNARVVMCNGPDALKLIQGVPDNKYVGNTYWIIGRIRNRLHFGQEDWWPTDRAGFVICPHCGRHPLRKFGSRARPEKVTVADMKRLSSRQVCEHCDSMFVRPTMRKLSDYEECACGSKMNKKGGRLVCADKRCGAEVEIDQATARDEHTCRCGGSFYRVGLRRVCRSCQNSLTDRIDHTVSPAYYIAKKLKRRKLFDLALIDEAHEIKGDGPQGRFSGALCQSARKVLMLTGTLTGGYAENLWNLFWRTMPRRLVREGFSFRRLAPFIKRFGAIEERMTINMAGEQVGYRPRRVAGISAQTYTRFLMPCSVFLQLAELGINMVPYKEYYHGITMDEPLAEAYYGIDKAIKQTVDALKAANSTSAESLRAVHSNVHVAMGFLDSLQTDRVRAKIVRRDRDGAVIDEDFIDIPIPALELETTAKERKLIEIARDAKQRGRKTLVYVQYTDERDCINTRLKPVLERHGFSVGVLKSNTVKPEKREEWLEKNDQFDVLICHPELIKVGLDVIQYPTLVFYQPTYNIYTHRQAAYRPWRPNQTVPVDVHVLAFEATVQETAVCLIASKLDSALLAEGIINDSELFQKSSSRDSILREMAKAMFDGRLDEFRLPSYGMHDVDDMLAMSTSQFLKVSDGIEEGCQQEELLPGIVVAPEVEFVESARRVLVTTYEKVGRRKVRVAVERDPSDVESGAQLSLF